MNIGVSVRMRSTLGKRTEGCKYPPSFRRPGIKANEDALSCSGFSWCRSSSTLLLPSGRHEGKRGCPLLLWFRSVGKLFYIPSRLPEGFVTFSIQRRPKPDRRVGGACGESQDIFASAAREEMRKNFFTPFLLFLLCSWQQGSPETLGSRDQREMIFPSF